MSNIMDEVSFGRSGAHEITRKEVIFLKGTPTAAGGMLPAIAWGKLLRALFLLRSGVFGIRPHAEAPADYYHRQEVLGSARQPRSDCSIDSYAVLRHDANAGNRI